MMTFLCLFTSNERVFALFVTLYKTLQRSEIHRQIHIVLTDFCKRVNRSATFWSEQKTCFSVCERNKKCRGWALKQVGTIRCKKHIFLVPQILEIGREMFCIYDINCDPNTIYNQDSLDACGLLELVDSC